MNLLREYIRRLFINENMCPIRGSLYGGIPAGGGFQAHKEYTVAAQQYFEAAHCILGSLSRRIGAPGKSEWHSMVAGEEAHITEEIGIMMNVIGEYHKELYIRQLNDLSQYKEEYHDEIREWNEGAIADIKKTAPKLIANAQEKIGMLKDVPSNEPEFPDSVYKVGLLTYQAIITAAEALLISTEDWDQTNKVEPNKNAWAQSSVRSATFRLDAVIKTMFEELG